jgi:hypothetical protein
LHLQIFPLHLPIFPLHLLEPGILPPLAYINPATPRTHEVGRGRQPSIPRNPRTHQAATCTCRFFPGSIVRRAAHLGCFVEPTSKPNVSPNRHWLYLDFDTKRQAPAARPHLSAMDQTACRLRAQRKRPVSSGCPAACAAARGARATLFPSRRNCSKFVDQSLLINIAPRLAMCSVSI